MLLNTFLTQYADKPIEALFDPMNPSERPSVDTQGVWSFPVWKAEDIKPPTSKAINAALDAPEPFSAALVETLVSAASASCDTVAAQIVPSETHRLAYTNAATIVWGSGGKAPTTDPAKTAFAALATSVGMEPDAFATVAQEISLASLTLATALSTLRAAAASAKKAADLKAALTAFEGSLASLVAALNGAGLTVAVTAPPAITIAGINA